jgi:predicted dehydrogenase
MTVDIKYGVIGNQEAVKQLKTVLAASQTGSLVAVVTDPANSRKLAEKNPEISVYSNPSQLLTSDVDVIYLAKGRITKFELAKKVLLHDKNLLLERPLTRHFVGASELFRIAKQRQLLIFENWAALYSPVFKKIKQLIVKKAVGDLQFFDIKKTVKDQPDWFYDLSAGGGALFNEGSLIIALIQYLADLPVSDWNGLKTSRINQADANCSVVLKAGNVLSSVVISSEFLEKSKFTVYGTKGTISVKDFDQQPDTIIITKQGKIQEETFKVTPNQTAYLIEYLNQCLLTNKSQNQTIAAAEMTLNSLKVIESLYQKWYGDPLN